MCSTMNKENWPLVTDEQVEFEKYPVEVHEFKKIIDHLDEYVEYTFH